MTFYSPNFIFGFLPVFVVFYALLGRRLRSAILFLGSIAFYWFASGGALIPIAVIFSVLLFNYAAGIFVGVSKGKARKIVFAFFSIADAVVLLSPKVMSIGCFSFIIGLRFVCR